MSAQCFEIMHSITTENQYQKKGVYFSYVEISRRETSETTLEPLYERKKIAGDDNDAKGEPRLL